MELKERYDYVYHELGALKEQYSHESDESESEFEESVSDSKVRAHFANVVTTMIKEFDKYLSQVPVFGFNSGKHDLNLVKRQLCYISPITIKKMKYLPSRRITHTSQLQLLT